MPEVTSSRRRDVLSWTGAAVAVAALGVVVWACVTGWDAVVHGHPAYAVMLAVTVAGAIGFGTVALAMPVHRGAWRVAGRVVLLVLAVAWVGLVAWLRPYPAVEPALAAMTSDETVTVTESAERIVLAPAGDEDGTAVFFQPGALVDPRAYAATLRPIAAAGHVVVITKQPLGIAFLATGDFDAVRAEHPGIDAWVVAGHSLGGTVAALDAPRSAGLLLYASYPADDMSALAVPVLSVSGTRDGLATPDKIEASRADLPAAAQFVAIEGASHAQFGAYGPQAGDNTPTIGDDDAREQISAASVAFVESVAAGDAG